MDDEPIVALLDVLDGKSLAVKRVQRVVDHGRGPDMGRMNG